MTDAEPAPAETAAEENSDAQENNDAEPAAEEEPAKEAPAAKPAKAEKPKKEPKKKAAAATKAKKPKKAASHPKYSEMIREALTSIKERGGSSRQAILKFIMKKYNTGHDEKTVNLHLKMALRAGVKNGSLTQSKGQ